MGPETIAHIRETAQSEHRTHAWADRTIEDLLTVAEQMQTLRPIAREAVRHLRAAAYRLERQGDPEAAAMLAAADDLADEIARTA